MSGKRFVETFSTGVVTDTLTGKEYKCEMRIDDKLLELLNDLHEENHSLKFQLDECRNHKLFSRRELEKENEQLKEEVELLREGLKAYDENLPLYLTCREIRDFNSDLFEFKIKQQKFYNEHPNLCKIIVDGVELK